MYSRFLDAYGCEVIRQASASHGLADVEGGPAAGHRVDDQGAGVGEVVEGVGDDRGRDRAGVGDAEGAVVPERPDVVGGRAEAGGEAVAAAQVLIGGVDRLGPGVELARRRSTARGSPSWATRQTARAWR